MNALLGVPFGVVSRLRRAAYERGLLQAQRLPGPVISVGNLAAGGRGKTPVVARIATLLREDGHAVAVLSRGYLGAFRGDHLVVSDGQRVLASAAEAGDEPVMLARQLPGVVVAVGKRRLWVGRAVERRFGPRVFVLDDGFQHLALARDLDIVCVAGEDLGGAPSSGGWLREGAAALARADLILLEADEQSGEQLNAARKRSGEQRTLALRRRVLGFTGRDGSEARVPRRSFLLAAIARPERFLADARAQGGEVAGTAFFRDHHAFSPAELGEVVRKSRAAGADALVTTAKDEVRLPPGFDPGLPVLVLRIAAEIENEPLLRERLRAVARRAA